MVEATTLFPNVHTLGSLRRQPGRLPCERPGRMGRYLNELHGCAEREQVGLEPAGEPALEPPVHRGDPGRETGHAQSSLPPCRARRGTGTATTQAGVSADPLVWRTPSHTHTGGRGGRTAPRGPATQPPRHPHCTSVVSLPSCGSHVALVLLKLIRSSTCSSQAV